MPGETFEKLRRRYIDGIVYLPPWQEEILAKFAAGNYPAVAIHWLRQEASPSAEASPSSRPCS